MAKRTLDNDTKALLERVGQRIVNKLNGEVFTVEGTPTVHVKLKDNSFRQKPMIGGQEFFLKDAYVGARGKLIFVFEPADAQEYQHAEIDQFKLDGVFPEFGGVLGEREEIGEEDAAKVIAEIIDLTKLREAKSQAQLDAEEAEKKKLAAAAAASAYANNPDYGRF
jgi:hypothetical protein